MQVRGKEPWPVARAVPVTRKVAERLPFGALEGIVQAELREVVVLLQGSCPGAGTMEKLEEEEAASAMQVTLSVSVEEGRLGKRIERLE